MLSILLIGVGLSMDAFAISVANGLTLRNFCWRHALLMGLYFGGFQFLMPLVGSFLGGTVSGYVSTYAPYISFFLLAFIGGRMLWGALKNGVSNEGLTTLSHARLLVMAVATSLDALAVGRSFAFMDIALLPACILIGCTTFVISVAGAMLGSKIPGISCRTAVVLGGCVLIGIGIKLLLQGIC
jgi:putative Mn2+ efflux pump MntP